MNQTNIIADLYEILDEYMSETYKFDAELLKKYGDKITMRNEMTESELDNRNRLFDRVSDVENKILKIQGWYRDTGNKMKNSTMKIN